MGVTNVENKAIFKQIVGKQKKDKLKEYKTQPLPSRKWDRIWLLWGHNYNWRGYCSIHCEPWCSEQFVWYSSTTNLWKCWKSNITYALVILEFSHKYSLQTLFVKWYMGQTKECVCVKKTMSCELAKIIWYSIQLVRQAHPSILLSEWWWLKKELTGVD